MKPQNDASTSQQHDDDENDSLADFDKSWEGIVMGAYRKARSNFERLVEAEGKAPYLKALSEPRRYKIDPMEEDEDDEIESLELQKCVDSKNKVTPIMLEEIQPTPPMIYWTLTEMNIKAEDQLTLSHIPYMGESDKTFCDELMEAFPDGIHGTKVGCGKYINDYILYFTVKYCGEAKEEIPTAKLYRLIYELFPNKIQKHELKEIYPDLLARFDPNLVQETVQFDEKGFQRDNVTPESLLHSYEVLQCQKCALYDCPHHINGENTIRKRHLEDPFAMLPTACSGDCYLARKDTAVNTASSTSKRRSNGSLIVDINHKSTKLSLASWTPQEESMMSLLRSVGINDCCLIARTLMQEPGSDHKKTCNDVYQYYCRNGPLSPKLNVPREMPIKKRKNDQIHRQFRSSRLHQDGKVQNQHQYVPCNHEGPCNESESCECFARDKICTKYCGCYDHGCKLQFPGCRCSAGNCRTKQCPCYYASWECDPDTCRNCHCAPEDEITDPNVPKCKNVCFQRGLQKRLSARPSQVAGWGCFSEENIEKNEFVSEYCGEIISHEESERRARISDKYGISYLFRLNNEQHVDATRKGNIIRFANHSNNPNCYAKVVVVNTEHRIGIFAKRFINAGEELFFNYSYTSEHEFNFLNRELDRTKSKVVIRKDKKNRALKSK